MVDRAKNMFLTTIILLKLDTKESPSKLFIEYFRIAPVLTKHNTKENYR